MRRLCITKVAAVGYRSGAASAPASPARGELAGAALAVGKADAGVGADRGGGAHHFISEGGSWRPCARCSARTSAPE
ncbi:MAG TPA: hypothetical protein VI072_23820 [Polyangiaceae bacterium]